MSIFSKFKKDKPDKTTSDIYKADIDESDERLPLSDPERVSEIIACGNEMLFVFFAEMETDDFLKKSMATIFPEQVRAKDKLAGDMLKDLLKPLERKNGAETRYLCGFKEIGADKVVIILNDEWDAPVMPFPVEIAMDDAQKGIDDYLSKTYRGFFPVGQRNIVEVKEINFVLAFVPAKIDIPEEQQQKLRTLSLFI
jgi:hypothetical protein